MKRMCSSDSLGGLVPICFTTEQKSMGGNTSNHTSRGFQSMLEGLDEEDCLEESSNFPDKKRRLRVDQVKALDKAFEVENKLEPERKVKLAQELGLQPRQVAVWFQNRRARWKTKQLERDYGVLKANYDSLKLNFDTLQKDKVTLIAELRELKSKEQDESTEMKTLVKDEIMVSESGNKVSEETKFIEIDPTIQDCCTNNGVGGLSMFVDFKDGASDSDSSAILNEDSNINSPQVIIPPSYSGVYPTQQFVKMEEHNFFGAEESCNFFSDDQAPTLQWCYSSDQWN
ncbi:hypothetical protein GIB67_031445 [Kingdonia uniflora]|uniref:Homeobox-leucine zipper protein n=1 Tax=Kingdonia uniflora TaxID=39325 RepID=A0A7J7MB60_9MAGN|nr:hypothetical protein GIB67_031445 [Kingdonia uniflora]